MRLLKTVFIYTTNRKICSEYFLRADQSGNPAVIAYCQNALYYEIPDLSGPDVRPFQSRNKSNCNFQGSQERYLSRTTAPVHMLLCLVVC